MNQTDVLTDNADTDHQSHPSDGVPVIGAAALDEFSIHYRYPRAREGRYRFVQAQDFGLLESGARDFRTELETELRAIGAQKVKFHTETVEAIFPSSLIEEWQRLIIRVEQIANHVILAQQTALPRIGLRPGSRFRAQFRAYDPAMRETLGEHKNDWHCKEFEFVVVGLIEEGPDAGTWGVRREDPAEPRLDLIPLRYTTFRQEKQTRTFKMLESRQEPVSGPIELIVPSSEPDAWL